MERFELEDSLKEEIRAGVLGDGFMKLVQSVRRNGSTFRISLSPIEIGGVKKIQAEMNDGGSVRVKNLDADSAASGLEEIIGQRGARDLHLMTAKGDLHLRVTKKGRVLVSRSAEMNREVKVRPHDRVKNLPLTSFDATALLRVIGIADGSGAIRASMRGKYDQVNEFLKVISESVDAKSVDAERPFTIVDCGCGKAYLTLALYFYLTVTVGLADVRVIGIDRRDDVISSAKKMALQLDVADSVVFVKADLEKVDLAKDCGFNGLDRADVVISLHACDTATDEAMARAVEWKAKWFFCAPCCQHELQKSLAQAGRGKDRSAADFGGLLRQSILRERLCDILTDSFRAMIMRILGYRAQVIEFVSGEATMRNVLIKGEWGVKPGQPGSVSEYLNLRDYWRVVPWLETRLSAILKKHLDRYES